VRRQITIKMHWDCGQGKSVKEAKDVRGRRDARCRENMELNKHIDSPNLKKSGGRYRDKVKIYAN